MITEEIIFIVRDKGRHQTTTQEAVATTTTTNNKALVAP